jgi:hypothetical protein
MIHPKLLRLTIATVVVAVAGVWQRERAQERKSLQGSAVVNNTLTLRVTRCFAAARLLLFTFALLKQR